MRRFTLSLIVVLFVAVAIIGVLWRRDSRELHATRTDIAVLRRQLANLPQGSLVPFNQGPVKSKTTDSPPSPTVVAPTANPPTRLSPQIVAAMKQQARWRKLSKKAAILADMNLAPGKHEKFKELIVERDYAEADSRNAARQVGIELDSATATAAIANAVSNLDRQIAALLGEADYERYTEITAVELMRSNLAQSTAEGYLIDLGLPLTPEQSKSLARAYHQEMQTRSREQEARRTEPDASERLKQSQAEILEAARPFLSTAQSEALQKFFREDYALSAAISGSTALNIPPR